MTKLREKFNGESFLRWQTNIAIRLVEEWLKQPNMTIEKALKELKEK